jgi:hypothetical protein
VENHPSFFIFIKGECDGQGGQAHNQREKIQGKLRKNKIAEKSQGESKKVTPYRDYMAFIPR